MLNMENLDKEINELKNKINEVKRGYEKTIVDFVKEKALNQKMKPLYQRLSFQIHKTIPMPNTKVNRNEKSSFTHISWAGEGHQHNLIAATTTKGLAYVIDVQTKHFREFNFTNSDLYTGCIEHSENSLLAAGGYDGGIYVTNIGNLKNTDKKDEDDEYKKFSGHQGVVSCCKFLNPFYLVSASYDSVILLWEINSQGKSFNSYHDHTSEVSGLDVNELNGNIFATGSGDTTVKLWDIREKKACVCTFKGSDTSVSCVKFLPGRYTTLAAGSEDSTIRLYDLRALKELACFTKNNEYNSVNSIGFSKSGQFIFASSNNSSKIFFWDIFSDDGKECYTYEHSGICSKGLKQVSIDSTGHIISYINDNQIELLK